MPGGRGRPKAESKAQQAVAGMAHAIQKGEMKAKPGTPSAKMAASMDPADTTSMAKTKHKGLPKHTPTGNLTKQKF